MMGQTFLSTNTDKNVCASIESTSGPIGVTVCFSAEASFAVGGALIPAGIFCISAAWIKKPSYLGLALVPLFLAIQQISEGFVWTALNHDDPLQKRSASLVFLFFALAFWPFWFPVLTTIMEPQPVRKAIFAVISVMTTAWFWFLFFPLLVGSDELLSTEKVHHSIRYQYDQLAVYQYIHPVPLRILYLLSIAGAPLLGSENWGGRIPGLVLGASALVAAVLFDYAFISVWCFFAAVLAVYLCVVFYRLPRAPTVTIQPTAL
jgi:hypothetical protein